MCITVFKIKQPGGSGGSQMYWQRYFLDMTDKMHCGGLYISSSEQCKMTHRNY